MSPSKAAMLIGGSGGGGGGETPVPQTNLQLHLKANAITGLAEGDPVTTWPDESSFARDATQATASLKPVWKDGIVGGWPVVRFDGVDDYLEIASGVGINLSPGEHSVYVVASLFTGYDNTGNMIPISCTGSGGTVTPCIWKRIPADGDLFAWHSSATGWKVSTKVIADDAFHLAEVVWDSLNSRFYVNGVAHGTQSQGSGHHTQTATRIGVNTGLVSFFKGDIAEILVYDVDHDTATRQSVENALMTKYGIV